MYIANADALRPKMKVLVKCIVHRETLLSLRIRASAPCLTIIQSEKISTTSSASSQYVLICTHSLDKSQMM
jgi:hypothetical protein